MTKKELFVKRTALIISTVFILSVFLGAVVLLSRTNFGVFATSDVNHEVELNTSEKFQRLGVIGADETIDEFYLEETALTEKADTTSTTAAKASTPDTRHAQTVAAKKQEVKTNYSVKIDDNTKALIDEVVRLTNVERAKAGLPALSLDSKMDPAAAKRAQEAATSFSHTRPNGSKWSTVFNQFNIKGKKVVGENLAMGQTSAAEVVADWMASETHRENILAEKFTNISIGIYEENGVLYWSQLFAG